MCRSTIWSCRRKHSTCLPQPSGVEFGGSSCRINRVPPFEKCSYNPGWPCRDLKDQMQKSRRQIADSRNRTGWRITRICCPPVIVFNCLVLLSQGGFGATENVDIRNIVLAQESATRAHHPSARLFQVFVGNLVLAPIPENGEY